MNEIYKTIFEVLKEKGNEKLNDIKNEYEKKTKMITDNNINPHIDEDSTPTYNPTKRSSLEKIGDFFGSVFGNTPNID